MSSTETADPPAQADAGTSADAPAPAARKQSKRTPAAARSRLRVVSIVFRVTLGVAMLAFGYGVFAALNALQVDPETRGVEERSLLVRTLPATIVEVPRTWTGYGTAGPMSFADVSAQVSGRIAERPASIEAGVPVAEGDLIARIEPTDFRARLASAEQAAAAIEANIAALDIERVRLLEQVELQGEEIELARNDVERTRAAIERGAGMQRELDAELADLRRNERALASLRQAAELIEPRRAALEAQLLDQQARIELARLDLDRTDVTSPIDGFIQRVDVERGELVAVGSPIARVVDLTRIEVPLRLPASSIGSVGAGDAVTLRVDGDAEGPWSGAVVRVAPEADAATRTVTVFVEVEQQATRAALTEGRGGLILPGRFLLGEVVGRDAAPMVLLPRSAVVADTVVIAEPVQSADDNGQAYRAREVPVRIAFGVRGTHPGIDPIEREWAAIPPGTLPEGARVITSNLDQLGTGTLVRLSDDTEDEEGDPQPAAQTEVGSTK